ncbi:MAG: ankyrin repeat domain-containing protein [Legionella sp.]|nr:ankyrin repeat domain-containing protein [Legionella sp.]
MAGDENLLATAVFYKNLEMVKLLLEYGYTDFQNTLHYAAKDDCLDVLQHLLKHTPNNVDLLDKSDKTPLHYAAEHGQLEALKELIKYSADTNKTDKFGNTPLHYAVKSRDSAVKFELLEELLKHAPDVEQTNNLGEMPFQVACESEDIESMRVLLQHGLAQQKGHTAKNAYLAKVLKNTSSYLYDNALSASVFDKNTLNIIFKDTSSLSLALNSLSEEQCSSILDIDIFKRHLKKTVTDVRNLSALFCALEEKRAEYLLDTLSSDLNNMLPDHESQGILISTLKIRSNVLYEKAKEILSAADSKPQATRSKSGLYFFGKNRKNKQNKGASADEGPDKSKGLD